MDLLTAGLFKSGAGGPVGVRLMSAPWNPLRHPLNPQISPETAHEDETEEK